MAATSGGGAGGGGAGGGGSGGGDACSEKKRKTNVADGKRAGGKKHRPDDGCNRLQSGGDNRLQAVAVRSRSVQDAKKDADAAKEDANTAVLGQKKANGLLEQWDAVSARRVMMKRIVSLLQARKTSDPKWLKKIPDMAQLLEGSLYRIAETKEQYLNVDTLKARLHAVANIFRNDCPLTLSEMAVRYEIVVAP